MSDVVLVDATTLIALGNVGRVGLLENFDGDLRVPELVTAEVTIDPAKTNVGTFLDGDHEWALEDEEPFVTRARELLGDEHVTGDVHVLAGVLHTQDAGETVAVVSDDRRVRTVSQGLDATVTGTVGVVVRAVHEGMAPDTAKDLIREIDSHGLHMTGELREKAFELVDDAAID